MLKFFFLCLLLANGLLFAFHQGHLEKLFPSGREPTRSANQLNADKFKLIPAPEMTDSASASSPAAAASSEPAVVDPGPKQNLLACTEIGNFNTAEAKRFEAWLAGSPMSGKLSRRAVQETSSHMILIPPQENKEGAEKKANELRRLGVTDFYIIPDNTVQRWGISLGVFKTEEAARIRLAALNQQGVQSARLVEHAIPLNRIAFQLRDLGGESQGIIDKIKAEFPRQEVRSCE
jgi:hypothetical protein